MVVKTAPIRGEMTSETTENGPLDTLTNPDADAMSVYRPGWLTTRLGKMARPPLAVTLVVPLRVPPDSPELSVTITLPVNSGSTLPSESNARTFTSGVMGSPAETLFG